GPLDRREVTAIRQFFQNDLGYRAERLLWVRDLVKEARKSTLSVAELCERLLTNYDLQARMIVLDVLTRVAVADGKMGPAETRFLDEVANRLGLGPFVASFGWARAGAEQQQQQHTRGPRPAASVSISQALATLGLDRGASADDIKQTWRRLSKENHPDRVTHLGEEFRRVAEARMRSINAAYDTLKNAGLVN
ncbi:MAG TPA: TerB family tellurite resistance protein, partial [Burkholderiales bacterium]|nr:TerB family tellurite resistance protein [Burkholderiales bacterium]